MRTFSSAVQGLINSNHLDFFYLLELNLSNDYFFTTASHDMHHSSFTSLPIGCSLPSNRAFLSDGGILTIDTPKFSSTVDREAYRITLTDLNHLMLAEFETNVVGKPITAWLGFYDDNYQPLLNTNDILVAYKGFVDGPAIVNDWQNKVATLEGTSPMSDLDRVNGFLTSRDGMDQVSSTDTSFDSIYTDSALEIKWGKV
jgi:hypothetical protein